MFSGLNTFVGSSSTTAELFFVSETSAAPGATVALTFNRVNLDSNAQTDLASNFKASFRSEVIDISTGLSVLTKISSLFNSSNNVYEYDILPKAPIFETIELISLLTVSSTVNSFDFATQPLEKVKGMVIKLTDGNTNLYLYQHKFPIALHRKSKLSFMSTQRNILKRVGHDVIDINKNIDFFMYNGVHYIVNVKRLEASYGLDAVINNMVNQVIPLIVSLNVIDMSAHANPLEIFDDLKKNKSSMRKIAKILNGRILSVGLTIPQIINVCNDFPVFSRGITFSNNFVDLSSQKKKLIFIRMLNDEAVRSALTNDVSLADDRESAA
ncbi:DUF4868 domain-containing protein [Pseudomonas syringae group genomosp. 3]|uniref:DUF4868 domain-containing protein n=1 Tax=Pseudomonas syringae pv. tomato (strain ATCC BAA-871 / DC3000) TaxID=223283 RepID=Q888D6_PSESM|nr:DUF4868 domain-containing protein [Pseudomonas syringae group genomosp. 3]AAO54619.1 protein of unknown function [Pseudomonas syringae pv. tomato str. DC3000]KPY97234.1 Uncharacterized protein ALO36_02615 [Pseudomonas syringae pv. tomato]